MNKRHLIAACLTAVIVLGFMWWIYDQEFHFKNTEAGRMAAVTEYIPQASDSTIRHGVKEGTPIQVVDWETIGKRLFIFYKAENNENVNGIMQLVRGINGKYRAVQADMSPSPYMDGIYGGMLTPRDTDQHLFYLAGSNCEDISSAKVKYFAMYYNGEDSYEVEQTYELSEANFLWIMEMEELIYELNLQEQDIVRVYLDARAVQLFDQTGNDVTAQYRNEEMDASWGGGKSTVDLSLLYIIEGVIGVLGFIIVYGLLKKDDE